MLEQIMCENFTVFKELNVKFSPKLNIFVGENGSGKTHLLKLAYSIISAPLLKDKFSEDEFAIKNNFADKYDFALYIKLKNVFSVKDFCDLISWIPIPEDNIINIKIKAKFDNEKNNIDTDFRCYMSDRNIRGKNVLQSAKIEPKDPIFFTARDTLSFFPWLLAMYEKYEFNSMSEAEYDTCKLFSLLAMKDLDPLMLYFSKLIWQYLGGNVRINGSEAKFVSTFENSRPIDTSLMPEGHKKLATLAMLIEKGIIVPGVQLFWDEPEANLNPKLIKEIAKIIFELSEKGVQIFIGTHSLFLIKEIDLLHREKLKNSHFDLRIFEFVKKDISAAVIQRNSLSEMEFFTALEEELNQASRILRS